MDELIAAAAEAMGVPPSMVERSAEARAKASGASVEDILRAWAGGEVVDSSSGAPAEDEPAAATEETSTPDTGPTEPQAAPAAVPMDEAGMVAAAAEKMGMPESMIRRSLTARSKASGRPEEEILREWAGAQSDVVPAPGAVAPIPAPAEAAAGEAAGEPTPAPAADPEPSEERAAPAPTIDRGELLTAAADKMGMPESMVERSADARAKAQGVSVEEVLAEWAGVEAAAAPTPADEADAAAEEAVPEEQPAAAQAAPPAAAAEAATTEEPAADEPSGPDVEVLGGEEPDEQETPARVSATPPPPEEFEPEEEAVAAGALPRWLAALFVFVPAFAIAYALFLPNGPNCGDAGRLAVDPVTGVAVNCDLSEFGEDLADFFAVGQQTYSGVGCVACHGAGGGGVANFPPFTDGALLSTFPEGQCAVQIEWISLGTSGWPEQTYGATDKLVGGSGSIMPGFAGSLTPEEIASVALYERVAFGGQDLDAAIADCGLGGDDSEVTASE